MPDVELLGSPTFKAMVKAGQIRIATKTDQPGLSYRDSVDWAGFDVGIENLIAAKLGFAENQINRVSAETNALSGLVSRHDVDLAVSAYTITEHRLLTINFAGPYFQAGQSLLVRRDEQQIVNKETLRGRTVCAVDGSTGDFKIKDLPLGQSKTLELANTANCVDALLKGDTDAVTTDDAILAGYQQLHPNELKIVGDPFSVELWGIGIAKGDPVLCQKINSILDEAMRDGTWAKIFDATLGRSGIQAHRPTPSNASCT
jgi:glutamate transport system substrate-binding protein